MLSSLVFSLFILGFSSLISQVILLRELMVSFYGNEFFLGLVLAAWLFWVGLGSFWLGKFFYYRNRPTECQGLASQNRPMSRYSAGPSLKALLGCHILVALLLPLLICLIRLTKLFTPIAGQIPDLLPTFLLAIFVPAPLCLILGVQFVLAGRIFAFYNPPIQKTISQAYLIETIGFVISGLIFSYFLVQLNIWVTLAILGCLNCLAVCLILIYHKKDFFVFKITSLILLFSFALLSFPQFNQPLESKTQQWRFPHQKLLKTIDSPYGQIAVTQIEDQYNFYESGLWLASNQENPFNESLAHFSLLQHPQPKNILLVGHGFSGLLNQILKHQPEKVYYLELDPWLIKATYSYLPTHLQQASKNPRVKIIYTDGRYFIKTTQEKFDLIIINLPDPSTALLNRFYTQECFEEIKKRLNPAGLLATYLSFSPNYQNKDLIKLNVSITQTIKSVFPYLMILPEETTLLFFAATNDILTDQSALLNQRWQERKIQTKFISPDYLNYTLSSERRQSLKKILSQESVKINTNSQPISYAYNFLFWTTYFHPQLANFFRGLLAIDFWWILIGFFLMLFALLAFRKTTHQETITNQTLWLAMAIGGFSLMAVEVLLIFAFQSFYGYLYYRLALLIAAFMLGLASGTWLGSKHIQVKIIKSFSMTKIHLVITAYSFFIGFLFFFWSDLFGKINLILSRDILFPVLAIIIGCLVGLEFSYANHLYTQNQQKKPFHTGFIYSADLLGSCLGALLTALFLIPLLGTFQALLVLIMVNLLIAILLQRSRR
jgi:spermidine synthase